MISEGRSYFTKVSERMEQLEYAIYTEDYEHMEKMIDRLLKYEYMFDEEQRAVYEEALGLRDSPNEEFYEPGGTDY